MKLKNVIICCSLLGLFSCSDHSKPSREIGNDSNDPQTESGLESGGERSRGTQINLKSIPKEMILLEDQDERDSYNEQNISTQALR